MVTIFISCMGLFGVALFSAASRTREIGIRKVLGASVGHIVVLLTREFVLLVLLSIFISVPIRWWVTHRWLEGYVYRIQPGVLLFTLAGVSSIGIALLTVVFRRCGLPGPIRWRVCDRSEQAL